MLRSKAICLSAASLLAVSACRSAAPTAPDEPPADAPALTQLNGVGDDAAVVVTWRPSAWSGLKEALAKVPATQAPPWLAELAKAESPEAPLTLLLGPAAGKALAGQGVRATCALGVVDAATTSQAAALVGAVMARLPLDEALSEARGRCLVAGVSLADVAATCEHLGLSPAATQVATTKAWTGPGGLVVAAREEGGGVVLGGSLPGAVGGAARAVDDVLVERLLAPPAETAMTPGLRALAAPGSVGGVLVRFDAARRLGVWLGLREASAVFEDIDERYWTQIVGHSVSAALDVDRIVQGAPADAVDFAFVLGGDGGRLEVTATQSLTAHGAAVVNAALGQGAKVRGPAGATPGAGMTLRFDAAAALAAAGGAPPRPSLEAVANAGVWGYVELLAHVWSLLAGAADAVTAGLAEVEDAAELGPDGIAAWSIHGDAAAQLLARSPFRLGGLGVTRVDGLLRRSGSAVVARWVLSFTEEAPAVTTPDAGGEAAPAAVPTEADRCFERGEAVFAGLVARAGADDAASADLTEPIATLAATRSCLGGSEALERRLGEMVWAARTLVASQARARWDRGAVRAALPGACEPGGSRAACAMLKANDAAPPVKLLELDEACGSATAGTLVYVASVDGAAAAWVGGEEAKDAADLAARVAKRGDHDPPRAILLIDPSLTVAAVQPLVEALTKGGGMVFLGARHAGAPTATRLSWEPDADPGDADVLGLPPDVTWATVVPTVGTVCVARVRPAAASQAGAGSSADGSAAEAPADPSPAVGVTLAVSAKGFCPRQNVREVIERRADAFGRCAAEARVGAGKVVLGVTIGLSGGVEAVRVEENATGAPDVEACLASLARKMRFERPEGGICIVRASMEFSRAP
ncbi:MAG: AgmX/PglI C-terminal domain-containing protein [Myxococcales bacterium]|nr:AgmX/PglI C-terminal domain-containing protein [Myxococcales bacterium]